MTFTIEEIKKEWLFKNLNYSDEEIVNTFETVERLLGKDWIQKHFSDVRGSSFAIQIIDLGLILKSIENIPKSSKIIDKLKKKETFSNGLAEASILAYFKNNRLDVEIEPELQIGNNKKYPDFRIFSEKWVYVELTCPYESEHQKDLYNTMIKLSHEINNTIESSKRIETYLYRDPNNYDITRLIQIYKDLATKEESQELHVEDLAHIFVSPVEQEKLHQFKNSIEEKRPVLATITFFKSPVKDIISTIQIPFTDERAQEMLNRENEQLSKNEPGMIVIDVSRIPGGLKIWSNILRKRLQPNLNRRIGAVLLVAKNVSNNSMKIEKILIKHPNPYYALPSNLLEVMSN